MQLDAANDAAYLDFSTEFSYPPTNRTLMLNLIRVPSSPSVNTVDKNINQN